jgi:hypothetical protein
MQQAAMKQAYLTNTPLTIEEPESKREHRPFALWPLILVAAIVVLVALTSDPSWTWNNAAELQGGMVP